MRKSIITAALAGTIAVTGAAFAVPALAEGTTATTAATTTTPAPSATDGSTDTRPSPQARITDALKGLVTDGTITQAQADEVATTLADRLPKGGSGGHHGGHGGGIGHIETAAAKALGISEADLRARQQAGKSIADVAKEKGIDLATVTTSVTDAATTQIAQAVTDGKITQARADTLTATLDAKITEEIDEVHDGGRGGPFGAPGPSGSTAAPTPAAPTS